jgi:hypothetical protein
MKVVLRTKGASPVEPDRKRIAERVQEVVRHFGPTVIAVLRMLLELWWHNDHGPGQL